MTVNSGGILGGTGTLSSVTVSSSGAIAPGQPSGTMNISGSLSLAAGALLDYELDTPVASDMISCGSLVLSGQQFSDFDFTWTANFGPGTYDLIDTGSSLSGSLGSKHQRHDRRLPANLAVQGNELVLNVVPEPSTLALLGVGAMGLLGNGPAKAS